MLAPIFLALFGAGAVGWALAAARYGHFYRQAQALRRRNAELLRQLAAVGVVPVPQAPEEPTLYVVPGGRR
jgi:hypothetical protein